MNVMELYHFSKWMEEYGTLASGKYQALANVLNHNATDSQQNPVKEPLDELKQTLSTVPLEQLTSEQTTLLKHFGIGNLLGAEGVKFVQDTVEVSEFDPATAASEMTVALQSINVALQLMGAVGTAFGNLNFLDEINEVEEDRVTVRILFKDNASISDVAAWKSWSNEWHDIVRGVALCINEAPEDTRVIGATNGSIIMVLSGTLGFVALLALITKQLSSVIKEGLVIANAIEDLRHKKILNKGIETELKKQQTEISENGIKSIVQKVKTALGTKINGEQETALTKAVKKFLNFNNLGGDIDFVAPPEGNVDEGTDEALAPHEISEIRRTIEEIRSTKAEVKLLTNNLDDAAE